jgi:hypothetical protein
MQAVVEVVTTIVLLLVQVGHKVEAVASLEEMDKMVQPTLVAVAVALLTHMASAITQVVQVFVLLHTRQYK